MIKRTLRHYCLLTGCIAGMHLFCMLKVSAQNPIAFTSNKAYNLPKGNYASSEQKQTLQSFLTELNKVKGVYFLYSDDMIGHQLVTPFKQVSAPVEVILSKVLEQTSFKFKKVSDNTYVIINNDDKVKHRKYENLVSGIDDARLIKKTEKVAADPIRGQIRSSEGTPLSGVSITVKGTTRGTTTNSAGAFTLDVNPGETLVITYVGYASQEFVVNNNNQDVSITLTPNSAQMSEVVVTALGIRRESKRLGYAVTKVNGEEFTQAREINLGNALTGRVAGVNSSGPLTGPGGSSRVLIRGINSLTGDNQPLYVVNGIPMNNTNMGNAGKYGGSDLGEGITSINPDDIEEITVLKGGAAAALYGQIAKNGVILITTKSGRGKKGLGIELNSNVQLDRINNFLEFQDVYGQGTLGAKPVDATSALNTGLQSWGARLDGSPVTIFNGQTAPYSAQGDNLNR
ncbi:MAG TPA: carboxypeptidase-like regulatory domain-containing protein, partial [Flavisolibacter sp.]|nr:carboxypeptidase-like regulatory domain-containing protein [Flavisolibacter sp.]